MYQMIKILVAVTVVGLAVAPAYSALNLSYSGLPSTFTPGSTLQFEVHLAGAQQLSAYNIELLLSGPGGVAGSDYIFTLAEQAAVAYVFSPDPGNFLSAIQPPGAADRLTLSDFILSGAVDTVAGINDRVATVTVMTSPSFSLPITISLAPATLELLDELGNPIQGALEIATSPPSASIPAVPEPASLLLGGTALLTLRRQRQRSTAAGKVNHRGPNMMGLDAKQAGGVDTAVGRPPELGRLRSEGPMARRA